MIEAAKTTASPAAIWTIVVVAVACLAFWLGMVAWADLHPRWRGRHVPELPGPVIGGMHLGGGGRSVSPNREAPSVLTDVDEEPYDQRDYDPEREMASQWREATPGTGEFWLPVPLQHGAAPRPPAQTQPTQARPAPGQPVPPMPAQRTSEADQPNLVGHTATSQRNSRRWWSRHR